VCGGVQIHVTDARRFTPFLAGIAVVAVARRLGRRRFAWKRPPYEFEHRLLPIDILFGTDTIRRAIEAGRPLGEIERAWQPDLRRWLRARKAFLEY
jgi:uncharacterized protein YbbC (DUF1343 family)